MTPTFNGVNHARTMCTEVSTGELTNTIGFIVLNDKFVICCSQVYKVFMYLTFRLQGKNRMLGEKLYDKYIIVSTLNCNLAY